MTDSRTWWTGTIAVVVGGVFAFLIQTGTSRAKTFEITGNATAVYTLSQCIERALEKSPKVLAAGDAVMRAGSEIGVARADFFPQASAYVSRDTIKNVWSGGLPDDNYEDQTQTTLQLQLTQTLFAGMTIINNYQRSLLNEEYVRAQKIQEEMSLVLEVQTTFFDRLKGMEDVARLQASVDRLELNAKVVRAFLDKEMISYSSVLEVEAELADSRQQLSQARNFVAQKTTELKTLIQVPDELHVDFLGNLQEAALTPLPLLEKCLARAFANRAEITVGQKGVAMALKDRDIAKGHFYPKISASVSYNERDLDYDELATSSFGATYDQDKHNNYYKGQLTLQWDLFQGGKKAYQVSRIRHEISRLENNLRQTKDLVATQVRKSYLSLKEARDRIGLTRTFLDSARENYDRALSRLQRMVGTILEVLVVEERLRDAEASHVKALADYRIALAELNYAVGRRYGSHAM